MSINPMEMMKLGERLRIFRDQHPKVEGFLHNYLTSGLEEGTILEIKVVRPDGRSAVCNMKVTEEDLETLEILRKLRG